jgi:hypothetical protein
MAQKGDLGEKERLGSGCYPFAKLTEQEELKSSSGVPHIFLGKVGRLNENRVSSYYCNIFGKQYDGVPIIIFENANAEHTTTL